jgi:hypothetical protein
MRATKVHPVNFVTCLGCLGWPRVQRVPGNRRFGKPARFTAWCTSPSCATTADGETLEQARSNWNERNYRA